MGIDAKDAKVEGKYYFWIARNPQDGTKPSCFVSYLTREYRVALAQDEALKATLSIAKSGQPASTELREDVEVRLLLQGSRRAVSIRVAAGQCRQPWPITYGSSTDCIIEMSSLADEASVHLQQPKPESDIDRFVHHEFSNLTVDPRGWLALNGTKTLRIRADLRASVLSELVFAKPGTTEHELVFNFPYKIGGLAGPNESIRIKVAFEQPIWLPLAGVCLGFLVGAIVRRTLTAAKEAWQAEAALALLALVIWAFTYVVVGKVEVGPWQLTPGQAIVALFQGFGIGILGAWAAQRVVEWLKDKFKKGLTPEPAPGARGVT